MWPRDAKMAQAERCELRKWKEKSEKEASVVDDSTLDTHSSAPLAPDKRMNVPAARTERNRI